MKWKSIDNRSAFQHFMLLYWNQVADDLYDSCGEALSDFRATEGDLAYEQLITEIQALNVQGRFPLQADIEAAYSDPFWNSYSRILVQEDLNPGGHIRRYFSNDR